MRSPIAAFVLVSLGGVACGSAPPAAPASPRAAERTLPTLATTCTSDADCAVFDTDVAGDTACCPGCTWHAANQSSKDEFGKACAANPAPSCPPIGCAMAIVEPKCEAGACVAAAKR